MADQRRTPRGSRPRGRAGPRRDVRSPRPAATPAAAPVAGGTPQPAERRFRPRLTGRAAILVLVLAVLAVSYASSLRAYLEQRSHIVELKETIAERRASIDELEQEKQRWQDSAYVSAQARERFGYVKPGATPFVVLGEDGEPLQSESELTDPDTIAPEPKRAWYDDVWDSVRLAGHPPTQAPPVPLRRIDGSDEQPD
ncbi:MAG TPA: septum formation initiator family protein [Nocardioides sp.]|nr:septum formation initiator family protein [Nocardioides sp.]